MEGRPADQLLCDSLILWVNGEGGDGEGRPPPPLGLIGTGAPSPSPSPSSTLALQLLPIAASSRFRAPFGLAVASQPKVGGGGGNMPWSGASHPIWRSGRLPLRASLPLRFSWLFAHPECGFLCSDKSPWSTLPQRAAVWLPTTASLACRDFRSA